MTMSIRDAETIKPYKPKTPFARQISGNFCQTAVYEMEVEDIKKNNGYFKKTSEKRTEEVYRMMARFSDTRWYVCDAFKTIMKDENGIKGEVRDIRNVEFFLNREQALFNLRLHDQKKYGDKVSSKLKVLISEEALGINHYNAFSAWQKLPFLDIEPSNKEQGTNKKKDHVVEDGTFLLSNFNQAVSGAPTNIEGYIADMMRFLIDEKLHALYQSERAVDTGTYLIKKRVKELFDCLRQQHEDLCQGQEKMSVQSIKKRQDNITRYLDQLIPQKEFLMEDVAFFKSEFAVLQTYVKCDWSKIPDVDDAFNERYDLIDMKYSDTAEVAIKNPFPNVIGR